MRGRDQQIECGQLGYKGHAVNVMQNIQSVATRLPRTVATLDYVVVRRRGADGAASRKFRVRREKVRGASEWLIANNPLYKDIRLDEDALASLPSQADPDMQHSRVAFDRV